MPGSLHIFMTSFFVKTTKIPKICCEIFISMCFVFACLALLSKKVNKLLYIILVTLLKTAKNQVTKVIKSSIVPSCQKSGNILEIFQKLNLSKKVSNKKFAPKLISFNLNLKDNKESDVFDIEN